MPRVMKLIAERLSARLMIAHWVLAIGIIGASLSEPHTYRTAAKNLRHIYIYIYMFFIYIYIYIYIYIIYIRPYVVHVPLTRALRANVEPAG